jgi:hypothetical protein
VSLSSRNANDVCARVGIKLLVARLIADFTSLAAYPEHTSSRKMVLKAWAGTIMVACSHRWINRACHPQVRQPD